MGWNYLSIPKLQRCNRWSLGMDKWFHPTLYWACDYLSMLGPQVTDGLLILYQVQNDGNISQNPHTGDSYYHASLHDDIVYQIHCIKLYYIKALACPVSVIPAGVCLFPSLTQIISMSDIFTSWYQLAQHAWFYINTTNQFPLVRSQDVFFSVPISFLRNGIVIDQIYRCFDNPILQHHIKLLASPRN